MIQLHSGPVKKHIINMIALLIGLATLIALAYSNKSVLYTLIGRAQDATQKQGILTDFDNENGYVELKKMPQVTTFTKGSVEEVEVALTLSKKQLDGFNIPIKFDPRLLQFLRVEGLDERFDIFYRFERATTIILIALRKRSLTDQAPLKKQLVARLYFTPISVGRGDVLVSQKTDGGYALNFFDNDNNAFIPSYGDLQISVK